MPISTCPQHPYTVPEPHTSYQPLTPTSPAPTHSPTHEAHPLGHPQHPPTLIPRFNSAIAFRVPRYHEVTPLAAPRPRYSLFGWFLQVCTCVVI